MSSLPKDLFARLTAEAAKGDMPIDAPVYAKAQRPLHEPVVMGSGSLSARLGVFGRDPGRHEIVHGEPFIGAGGQLVRRALHQAAFGRECPDLAGSIDAGRGVFWANTVPYKPLGNKAWSMKVKRRFEPMVTELLTQHWQGSELITLGNVAFAWFGVADKSLKPALKEFWAREDRYSESLEVVLNGKTLRLHPLPHPSPLNATWYKRFPDLLADRLRRLEWQGQ